jgi:predicted lipid-binding transport protein (Tim44 family)
MKKNMLIVTVVILSLVLAALIGLAVWLELRTADPESTEPAYSSTEPSVTTEPVSDTTVPATEPAQTTVPTEPDMENTWPIDDL